MSSLVLNVFTHSYGDISTEFEVVDLLYILSLFVMERFI